MPRLPMQLPMLAPVTVAAVLLLLGWAGAQNAPIKFLLNGQCGPGTMTISVRWISLLTPIPSHSIALSVRLQPDRAPAGCLDRASRPSAIRRAPPRAAGRMASAEAARQVATVRSAFASSPPRRAPAPSEPRRRFSATRRRRTCSAFTAACCTRSARRAALARRVRYGARIFTQTTRPCA
jgi:hypothetical protein